MNSFNVKSLELFIFYAVFVNSSVLEIFILLKVTLL